LAEGVADARLAAVERVGDMIDLELILVETVSAPHGSAGVVEILED